MRKKSEPHNSRQTTHLSNISEYTTEIREIAGKDNIVADALSRAPVEDGAPLSPLLEVPNVAASLSVAAIEGNIVVDDITKDSIIIVIGRIIVVL